MESRSDTSNEEEVVYDGSTPLPNVQEEAFVINVLSGMSQVKAYEAAGYIYDTGHASRKAALGSVRARLLYLQAEARREARITLGALTDDLFKIRDKAAEQDKLDREESTTMNIAKLNGLIVDKAKVDQTVNAQHAILLDIPEFTKEERAAMLKKNGG